MSGINLFVLLAPTVIICIHSKQHWLHRDIQCPVPGTAAIQWVRVLKKNAKTCRIGCLNKHEVLEFGLGNSQVCCVWLLPLTEGCESVWHLSQSLHQSCVFLSVFLIHVAGSWPESSLYLFFLLLFATAPVSYRPQLFLNIAAKRFWITYKLCA